MPGVFQKPMRGKRICVDLPAPSPLEVTKTPVFAGAATALLAFPLGGGARAHSIGHGVGHARIEGIGHDELLGQLLVRRRARPNTSAAASFANR